MTCVLLAEDDSSISEPLARALRREGYDVDVAADGPGTLEAAQAGGIDLIVLDIGLPRLDGLEVCRRLRSDGQTVPVLILTARADEVDTVIGLDAGADDYVTKPFRLAELLARVRALLRRGTPETSVVQGVRVDADARRAWIGDTELELTTKEFDLLSVLAIAAGTALTLALVGILLGSWLSARTRLTSFALLRALGSEPAQLAGVLLWEQGIIYALALGLGVVMGFVLAAAVLPVIIFTNGSLKDIINTLDVPPIQTVVPWPAVGAVLGGLLLLCGAAVLLMTRVVARPSIGQALRLNED